MKETFHEQNRGEFMTLDEAIAHEKELSKEIYIEAMLCNANPDDGKLDDCIERGKYHEQLAEWLEELKFIRQWKSDIMEEFCRYDVSSFEELVANTRNKAIDDYMNKLCNHFMQQTNECYKLECPFCTDGCDIVNISEQLKAGITND